MDGVGAADVGHARLGQAEEAHLALPAPARPPCRPRPRSARPGRRGAGRAGRCGRSGAAAASPRPPARMCSGRLSRSAPPASRARCGSRTWWRASPASRRPFERPARAAPRWCRGRRPRRCRRRCSRARWRGGAWRSTRALVGRAVGLAHAHAAEADRPHFEPLTAQFACAEAHDGIPLPDQSRSNIARQSSFSASPRNASGHRSPEAERRRGIADALPAEPVAQRIDGAVRREAGEPASRSGPSRLVAEPQRQVELQGRRILQLRDRDRQQSLPFLRALGQARPSPAPRRSRRGSRWRRPAPRA